MDLQSANVKDEGPGKRKVIVRNDPQRNTIANIINFIGWLSIILSVISIASTGFSLTSFFSIPYLIYGVLSGFLLIGFSEIINLLQRIYINTSK